MSFSDVNRTYHCTNCGLSGHIFRNCLSPITSYGIIAVRYMSNTNNELLYSNNSVIHSNTDDIQFLLIQRKDSLSFVEFIRGKYIPTDEAYIGKLLRGMTKAEQELLKVKTFDELWKGVWGESSNVKSHKNDYENSDKKYNQIKPILDKLININPSNWDEPEWGFPKGRRNPHESDINCAIREFQEETALKRQDITILQNILPISETFFGSNQVHYCHKYYISLCNSDIEVKMNMENPHMAREIGAIKWCSLDEATSKIRPDNVEKREILLKAGKIMRNFYPVNTTDLPRSIQRRNDVHFN
jgi:8-oxo-dGTP pyrophosphatase MutT (NUDIX family)